MKKQLTPEQAAGVLGAQTRKAVEGDRPQSATVTRITDRTTDGSVTCTLDRTGDTIWVETGGDIADISVSDVIWVVPLVGGGVSGKRAQWMMFKYK